MPIARPNYNPPSNVSRASHARLHLNDMAKSRAVSAGLIGLIISEGGKGA